MKILSSNTLKVLPLLLYFSACKDYKPEMEQAMWERDSILVVNEAKDSSLNSFIETLNEIEINLDSITQAQNAISMDTKNSTEFNQDIRDRISTNISLIGDLLKENQDKIETLNSQLRKSNINLAALRKKLDRLTEDLQKKDAEISVLNEQLLEMKLIVETLNVSVDSLNTQNQTKESIIADQTNQINTAYYITGNYKDLKAKNIISAEGGFLGIGKEKLLKQDFNTDSFIKIDITKVTEFVLNNKSIKVVTNHPTDSYTLVKDDKDIVTSLKVTNPTRFWKTSKYLVIITG